MPPEKQRAWMVVRRGSPRDALELQDDVPVPKPSQGEVLVQIEAAALNPAGSILMRLLPNYLAGRPHIAENDFAGVVADGNGTEFNTGDKVFGVILPPNPAGQGTLSSFVKVPTTHLALRPPSWTSVEAAGLACVGLTAYFTLINLAKIEPGQNVFVNGGSSSVGSLVVQLAKARGCRVVASCSGPNVDLVKSLGADEVLDYTKPPLHEQLTANPSSPRFHVIVDVFCASSLFLNSETYLTPSGIYLIVGGNLSSFADLPKLLWDLSLMIRPTWLGGTNRKWRFVRVDFTKDLLESVAQAARDGQMKPPVDSVYTFDKALDAFDRILTKRARGKVIVTVPT